MDDMQSQNNDSFSLLNKMMPFLLHPNTWIREETLSFILIISDYQNTKLLTKAEVYCVILRKLRPYLRNAESASHILFGGASVKDLVPLLRAPLSRNIFEQVVKTDYKKLENMHNFKQSDSDKYAFDKLRDIIEHTQRQYQQDS